MGAVDSITRPPALHVVREVRDLGICDCIGNTPLLRLRLFEKDAPDAAVYAKAEFMNPGGSVKDRPALSMIEEGERRGVLTHDKAIIDSTSGNTGIAYALIGAAKSIAREFAKPID